MAKEVEIPDSLTVLGRFRSGIRLVYHFSGVEAGPGRGEIRINGTKACLRFDTRSGALFRTDVPGQDERPVEIPAETRRGWRVEEDFVNSIRTQAPVLLTSFPQGLRYMKLVEAVWHSWKNGGRKTVV